MATVFDAPILDSPSKDYFIYPLAVLFGGAWLLGIWVQSCGKRDNSWIDVFWSVQIVLPNIVVLGLRLRDGLDINLRMLLAIIITGIWCLRLSIYIFVRHKKEDYRYKEMRENWEQGGTCAYLAKAMGFVFTMQPVFSIINGSSLYYITIFSAGTDMDIMWTDIVGAVIWLMGFLMEVFADRQLANHLANPKPGSGKFLLTGLWRYSRHPNYFGEAVMWWGVWIIACSLKMGFITVFSCAFITFSLRFLSGVPFPEKKYNNKSHPANKEWEIYKLETNCFVLWPYKKVTQDQFEKNQVLHDDERI